MPLVLAQLLQAGGWSATSLNDRGTYGWAPLHILAPNKNNAVAKTEMIGLLLDNRADPNIRGNRGATPLFKAAGTAAKSQMVRLLQGGADPNLANEDGVTPLDSTWANRDCREVLSRKGGRKGSGVTGKGRS